MTTSASPGECGKRLLPAIIDQLAHENPDRSWGSIPRNDYDLSQGYADISYAAFANAINKLAWMVEKYVGRSDHFETIAYLGASDVRYHMVSSVGARERYRNQRKRYFLMAQIHLVMTSTLE